MLRMMQMRLFRTERANWQSRVAPLHWPIISGFLQPIVVLTLVRLVDALTKAPPITYLRRPTMMALASLRASSPKDRRRSTKATTGEVSQHCHLPRPPLHQRLRHARIMLILRRRRAQIASRTTPTTFAAAAPMGLPGFLRMAHLQIGPTPTESTLAKHAVHVGGAMFMAPDVCRQPHQITTPTHWQEIKVVFIPFGDAPIPRPPIMCQMRRKMMGAATTGRSSMAVWTPQPPTTIRRQLATAHAAMQLSVA